MIRLGRWSRLVLSTVAATLIATVASAQVSSLEPAAVLIFPYLVADAQRDTIIEIANVDSSPVPLRCFYDDQTPLCTVIQEGIEGPCMRVADPDACRRACSSTPRQQDFFVRLTPGQPLSWSLAGGRVEFPLPTNVERPPRESNAGSFVPPVETPFLGVLRCVALNDAGDPSDANSLIGSATIRALVEESGVSDARYNAAGLRAQASMVDGNDLLAFGGEDAEYQGCAETLVLPHYAEGVTLRTFDLETSVLTTMVVVPCGSPVDARTTLRFLVFNEFSQRFSTSRISEGQFVSPLVDIDRSTVVRSIFSASVNGTLTLQTQITATGAEGATGIVGVGIERHDDDRDGTRSFAAAGLLPGALQLERELLSLRLPSCTGDCDKDGFVTVDELMLGVNIALGLASAGVCRSFDLDFSEDVSVDEVISGSTMALHGCVFSPPRLPTRPARPEPTPLPTPSGASGPDIVALAVTRFDGTLLEPDAFDEFGRPVFVRPFGQGLIVVIEARRGTSGQRPGNVVFDETGGLPDLQIIVSRDLGDGSAAVCDAGGVPATQPFEFDSSVQVRQAVNDLGCRAIARDHPVLTCVRAPGSMREQRISSAAEQQFCLPIAKAWRFPVGDTIVAVRVRDEGGTVGPVAEMVVRVLE